MTLYQGKYRTESTRLPYWDYASTALYFITICTKDKKHTLGSINNDVFTASTVGRIADQSWLEIPEHFPYVTLDKYQVMPNHIHGIIHISATQPAQPGRDTIYGVSTAEHERKRLPGRDFGRVQKGSLSLVLQHYKASVKRACTKQSIKFNWQKNFHDHVIRDEKSYQRIRWYIENNVAQWAADSLNPNKSRYLEFPAELLNNLKVR